LPAEIVERLETKWHDLSRAAMEAMLAEAYRDDLLTAEHLRRTLGFTTRMQVDEFLKIHNVATTTLEDFRDRETRRKLRAEEAV
jgi:uncharacterized protein UPF0175